MKLLGDGPIIDKDKNGVNVPQLEDVNSVLVNCSIVNNTHQEKSKLLHSFVPNKRFGQLININPTTLMRVKPLSSEYDYIEVYFTDQSGKPLEIEDDVNITLTLNTKK